MNRKITIYLIILLFVIPIFILPPEMFSGSITFIRDSKHQFMRVAVALLLLFFLPGHCLKLFYGVIAFHSIVFFGPDTMSAFWWITLFLALYSIVYHFWDDRLTPHAKNTICIVHITIGLFLIAQYFHFPGIHKPFFSAPEATFSNPNITGSFFAISGAFFFRKKWNIFIPFSCFCLYIATAECAIIAYVICLLLYITKYLDVRGSSLLLLLGIGFIVFQKDTSQLLFSKSINESVRGRLWKKTIEFQFIKEFEVEFDYKKYTSFKSPWYGYGLNNFQHYSLIHDLGGHKPSKTYAKHAHNEWLQSIFELGPILSLPIFIFLFLIAVTAVKRRDPIGLSIIVILINAVGHFPIHTVMVYYAVVLIAVYHSKIFIKEHNKKYWPAMTQEMVDDCCDPPEDKYWDNKQGGE